MKIRNYNLDDELIIEIGRFSVLWNCFERFQCNNSGNPNSIKAICAKISIDKDKEVALTTVLNKRRSFYNMIVSDYVQQGLFPTGARQPQEDDKRLMEEFLEQSGDDLTCGCLLTIYRIRNNLMHGLKQIEDLNNQLNLFKAVNEVLESVRKVS